MNKETRIILKDFPTWKPISMYDDKGKPIVPENCIVRDGYYLDMFDLGKLPKADDSAMGIQSPELTWSTSDDYALGTVAEQIYEARRRAIEEHQDTLSDQLKRSEDWLKLLEHRLTVAGMRPIEEWYSNYRELDNKEK